MLIVQSNLIPFHSIRIDLCNIYSRIGPSYHRQTIQRTHPMSSGKRIIQGMKGNGVPVPRTMPLCKPHLSLDLAIPWPISMCALDSPLTYSLSLGFKDTQKKNLINRTWRDFRAQLWTYDPEFDPPELAKYNQFGTWIFVARNPKRRMVNGVWQAANKWRIAVDPGGKVFETINCIGTGDIFYLAPGLSDTIRYNLNRIGYIQSKIDNDTNVNGAVIDALNKWNDKTIELDEMVCSLSLSPSHNLDS